MRRVKFKAVRVVGERRVSAYARGAYCLNYLKDSVVRAREETLGIAVFGRRSDAEKFCYRTVTKFNIIRVLPVGRGRTVEMVSQSTYMLDIFYSDIVKHHRIPRDPNLILMKPPRGTIFYPAVEVIE